MDNESAIQKHIDNRPVRHLDRDRDDADLARDRLDPVRQPRQSGAAVPEFTLSRDAAVGVENAGLVFLRTPIDSGKPTDRFLSLSSRSTRAATTPADLCTGARGATSYWASAVANLPGHKSNAGARGTGARMVAPGRSARTVSLRRYWPSASLVQVHGGGWLGAECRDTVRGMRFMFNAARRHHIPRARYRVRNWTAYETRVKRRGDLTLWIDEAALDGWQAPSRSTPGGQAMYSDLAIEMVLMLRLVFHLALHQAEAFARSVLRLLGLDLCVPDHTTPAGVAAISRGSALT
jgi:hypothetical protein